MTLNSREICALVLSFIALTDIFIILDIPVLRQVFGFVLLTVLPGFLIIQIIRFGRNSLEKTLFLVGLSISFLLFVPLLMNFAYPVVGISRPISLWPLVVTFSVILALLCLIAHKKGSLDLQIDAGRLRGLIGNIVTPPALGAALIVVIGIIGALCLWFFHNSMFSLLSSLSIVLIVVLIVISNKVSQRFYPLYIFAIAIALLYSRTLASPNLFGSDGMYELYFSNLVNASGVWDPSFSISGFLGSNYYSMLSVAFLPNVYSILLNLDNIWVFKLIYPIIFAFVPLGLYELFRTQVKFSNKSAFLAVFLFMSFFAFFQSMPALTKQEIAELFFVLAALLIMNRYSRESYKTALLMLFIASMVVSHYATSYIFLIYLVIVFAGSALATSRNQQKGATPVVTATIAALAIVIAFGWYMLAGAGTSLESLLNIGTYAVNVLSNELFSGNTDPYVVAGLGGSSEGLSFIHVLGSYWQILAQILITIGLTFALWRRRTLKMSPIFLSFSLVSFFILLIVAVIPARASGINSWRFYSYALFFLAPCCILGIETVVEMTSHWLGANRGLSLKLTSAAFIVVLMPYFLFSYGFIFEITDHPTNYAFLPTQNPNGRDIVYANNATWSYLVAGPVSTESVRASAWLSGFMGVSRVYADLYVAPELSAYGHISPSPNIVTVFSSKTLPNIATNAYIYLGPANVQQQNIGIRVTQTTGAAINLSSVPKITNASEIYSNGLVEVYYTR